MWKEYNEVRIECGKNRMLVDQSEKLQRRAQC